MVSGETKQKPMAPTPFPLTGHLSQRGIIQEGNLCGKRTGSKKGSYALNNAAFANSFSCDTFIATRKVELA